MFFFIKELFNSIRTAKLSFVISIFTASVSILIILSAAIAIISAKIADEKIKEKIEFVIYLKNTASLSQIKSIEKKLNGLKEIARIDFIDKKKAEENFILETGEDFRRLLDYNPLPNSFVAAFKKEFSDKKNLERLQKEISGYDGVDEVIFAGGFIFSVLDRLGAVKSYLSLVAGILTIISFYLVYSSNRLIIHAKMAQYETMKLVGAKISAIKVPIILYGFVVGVVASVLSAAAYYFLIRLGSEFVDFNFFNIFHSVFYYIVLLAIGPIIGLLGSYAASKKISLKINEF